MIGDLCDSSVIACSTRTGQTINLVLSTIRAAKKKRRSPQSCSSTVTRVFNTLDMGILSSLNQYYAVNVKVRKSSSNRVNDIRTGKISFSVLWRWVCIISLCRQTLKWQTILLNLGDHLKKERPFSMSILCKSALKAGVCIGQTKWSDLMRKDDCYRMKATGIVRRIDDLGRVVIPKEIRRTMRIREGDPLEIYTDHEGGVIFKKYSQIGELSTIASQLCESVSAQCGMPVIICDRDHCIASAGISKREVGERRITSHAEELMEKRTNYYAKSGVDRMLPLEGVGRTAQIFMPVVSAGDITGAVALLEPEQPKEYTEADQKLCAAAAAFLGKQMEE